MERKEYLSPDMEVVELLLEGAILSASDGNANTDNPTEGEGGNLF